jgi:hypothetical protein
MADGFTGNVRVLMNRFPEIAATMAGKADSAVGNTAERIASEAQGSAPRLQPGTMVITPRSPGELAASISAHQVSAGHWEVEATAEYAAYVEYGTAEHGGPQPYLVPAAHHQEPGLAAEVLARIIT